MQFLVDFDIREVLCMEQSNFGHYIVGGVISWLMESWNKTNNRNLFLY